MVVKIEKKKMYFQFTIWYDQRAEAWNAMHAMAFGGLEK